MRSWSAVSNAPAVIIPAERSKRWGLFSSSEHSSQMALTSTLVSFKHVHCFYLMRTHITHTLGHTFLFHSCVSRARASHAECTFTVSFFRMAYANLPQWAFLHWWRALPETSLHFLMFNDTLKSFPLPFFLVSIWWLRSPKNVFNDCSDHLETPWSDSVANTIAAIAGMKNFLCRL